MEVKTGVECLPAEGYLHPLSDPIQQAEKNRKNIAFILANSGAVRSSDGSVGYAVCFPGLAEVGRTAFDAGCILADDDLQDGALATKLSSAFDYWKLHTPLSKQALQQAKTALHPFDPSPDQRALIGKSVSQKVGQATARQYAALKSVLGIDSPYTRVAINGCAGSGKTRIAIEAARSLATGGMSVLLACFNTNLSLFIERDSKISDLIKSQAIEVRTYYSIAGWFLREANARRNREGDSRLTRDSDWNNRRYDGDVETAVRETPGRRFDAIIIDEGQDFDPRWVRTISQMLKDPGDGRLVFLYDVQQQLYPLNGDAETVVNEMSFQVRRTLTTNCRNPAPIHDEVMKYHPNGTDFIPLIDAGLAPEHITLELQAGGGWSAKRLFEAHRNALEAWLKREKPRGRDVVLIAPHGKDRISFWSENVAVGDYTVTTQLQEWIDPGNRRNILLSTTRTFKGLEAPYVIVIEMEGINETERQRLLYTTLSRAKQQLVYMLPKGLRI